MQSKPWPSSTLIWLGQRLCLFKSMKPENNLPQMPEPDPDAESQSLLQKAETALDDKTREFIAEALRYVPEELATRYEIEVSHEGVLCGNEG